MNPVKAPPHHLIFEGAELTGKTYLIHEVWKKLEARYHSGKGTLDGCIWFNADVGLYGTRDGWPLVESYLKIAKMLSHRNIIFEKLHLTQYLYSSDKDLSKFRAIDNQLVELNFKIVLTISPENEKVFSQRLIDRLHGDSPYKRIAHSPSWYLKKQQEYQKLLKESQLPHLTVENQEFPNNNYQAVLNWLGET